MLEMSAWHTFSCPRQVHVPSLGFHPPAQHQTEGRASGGDGAGGGWFCPIHRWRNEDLKFYFFILSLVIILSKGSRNPLLELGDTEYLLITEAPGGIAHIFLGWNNTLW